MSPKAALPSVVLGSGEEPGTQQPMQQPPHVLSSDGAAFQRGLDTVPHKDEEQGGRGQLLYTLHCFLRTEHGSVHLLVQTLQPTHQPGPILLTFMSLRWRYSSMMALDFFSSSSSESAAFRGLTGGSAASRFTAGQDSLQFQSSQCTQSGAPENWGQLIPD